MVGGSLSWATEEFGAAELGDRRRTGRLVRMAAGFADRPGGRVSGTFRVAPERNAVYRLLENKAVNPEEVGRATFRATVERASGLSFVYVPVDGSSLNITDDARTRGSGPVGSRKVGARGFQVMTAIGVSPDGTPLGLLGQAWWSRTEVAAGEGKRAVEATETQHWLDVMESVRAGLAGSGTRAWFQLDRGGDAWPVLQQGLRDDIWLTVRAAYDRRLRTRPTDEAPPYLWDTLDRRPSLGSYEVDVPGTSARKARRARMEVRSAFITLDTREKKKGRARDVPVWAVLASEVGTTPPGEEPLEWMLLTNRTSDTFEASREVVLGYLQRWRVEEFHKAWKSGDCNVEETQLQSEQAIHTLALVLAAVAMRLLRLTYLARRKPDEPASVEFSEEEIAAVLALKEERPRRGRMLTIGVVTRWIAEIGGYTGKSSGGPPGMLVLARGLAQVEPVARALRHLKHLRSTPTTLSSG